MFREKWKLFFARWVSSLTEPSKILISEELTLASPLGSPENGLSRVFTSETEDPLHQSEGSDSALFIGGVRPCAKRRAHSLAATEKFGHVGLLARGYRLFSGFRSELTGCDPEVRGDEIGLVVTLAVIDPHEPLLPTNLDVLVEQRRGHGIERALHFDMGIGMDPSSPTFEESEPLRGQGLECQFVGFQKMGPDLLSRRSMDPQPGDGTIPPTQELVEPLEAVESSPLEGVVLDVAAAAFLLAVLLRIARSRRQRRETPVLGEREIRGVHVGVVETSPHHGRFQVVVTNDLGHSLEIEKRPFV